MTLRSDAPSGATTDSIIDDVARGKRELLRHGVATLAYRGAKAVRGASPAFADFRIGETTRTPVQLLAHLGDLLDWAVSLAEGQQKWRPQAPKSWDEESARFFAALAHFEEYLASDRTLGAPAEKLLQGPVADALTYVGQIMMLRRLANETVRSENYAKADIVAGRVTAEQTPPKLEFDQ